MKLPRPLLRSLDRTLEWAKQCQRRLLASEYEDLRRKAQWMDAKAGEYYREIVFSSLGNTKAIKKILVFKPDEIGDAVVALPALSELRGAFPDTKISLLCQDKTAPVYERSGLFDEIVTFQSTVYLRRFPRFDYREAIKEFASTDFDVTIYLRTYPAYFNYFKKLPGKVKIHPRDPRLKSDSVVQPLIPLWGPERKHQTLQLLSIVGALTGKQYGAEDVVFPAIQWHEADRAGVARALNGELPKRYLVIHPFANYETKRYPESYWPELFSKLRERFGLPLLVIGGRGDTAAWIEDANIISLAGKLTLSETGYLMSRAAAFIGNESGPGHWAAALGVPVVSLMSGHSVPAEWAPFGQSLVLRSQVACAPCHLRSCSRYRLQCLTLLTPQKVWPAMESFLKVVIEGIVTAPKDSKNETPRANYAEILLNNPPPSA